MTVAPVSIMNAFDRITVPSKEFSGIVGDANHSFGYHLSMNTLVANGKADDYSLTLPRDAIGARTNPDAASALDVKLNPTDMVTVTQRLLDAARSHDPRMSGVREFCGTLNGVDTHPYDLSNDQDGPLNSWDNSHLWHIHLSFYRNSTANEQLNAMDVFNGAASNPTPAPLLTRKANVMLYQDATTKKAFLVLPNGKAVWVTNSADFISMRTAGVPASLVTQETFNRIINALGGVR